MKWHLTDEELPKEMEPVLIYIPDRPWYLGDKPTKIRYKVAYLVKGISLKEREALSDRDERKRIYRREDEGFNNKRPYCFEEFGPGSFFGQEVKAWSYIDYFEPPYEPKQRKLKFINGVLTALDEEGE